MSHGIKINFEFDLDEFAKLIDADNFNKEAMEYALESFQSKVKGNTTIGNLRCAMFEAIHTANSQMFVNVKGADLWFNDRLLSNDNDIMIDIVGLWNNSTLMVKPTKSVLEFTDAFFNHGTLTKNKHCLRAAIWNALTESVQTKDVKRWDVFCAAILQFWSENKNDEEFIKNAQIFTTHLFQFDPQPLRSFCGFKLLNIMMGTSLSLGIIKDVLFDESILYETDGHGTNPLMHCILENDLNTMDFILNFGLDLEINVDDSNNLLDFAVIYGSIEMSEKMNAFKELQHQKRLIVQQHSVFIQEKIPSVIVDEIAEFLVGEKIVKMIGTEELKQNEENERNLYDELEQSIVEYRREHCLSPTASDLSQTESVEVTLSRFRNQSSANELFEIEERKSQISVASN